VDAAEQKKHAAAYILLDAREHLALRVAQAYTNLLRARSALGMISHQHQKSKDYIGRISSMVKQGAADETELQQAKDMQMALEGMYADFKGQVRMAEADYMEAVGRQPSGALERPVPRNDLLPDDINIALEYVKKDHPALKAAEHSSDSARYDIRAERASLFPDFTGELSYMKADKRDIIGGEVVDGKAVVRMNWNLQTGGAQMSRIQKKKYQHEQALARIEETRRQVERGVRMAYAEKNAALEQLNTMVKRVMLGEQMLDTYKAQFEGARITLLQLMQAENQLFGTKLEKLNNEYRVLAANYSILASLGLLQDSLFGIEQASAAGAMANE